MMRGGRLLGSILPILCWGLLAAKVAAAADAGPAAPERIALPENVACTFSAADRWLPVSLQLPGGVRYAEVQVPDRVEMRMPIAAAPAPAGVKVMKDGLSLEGLMGAGDVPLHAIHPFLIDGLFLPAAYTTLGWTDAASGEVGVEATLSASTMKLIQGIDPRLHARRPCGDLGIDTASDYRIYEPVGGPGLDREVRLQSKSPIPVSVEPGGDARVHLVAPKPGAFERVTLIERRGRWARVGVSIDDLELVGWVPSSAVRRAPKRAFNADLLALGAPVVPRPAKLFKPFSCDHEVPLIARVGATGRTVGAIRAGVRMDVLYAGADDVTVAFAAVQPDNAASFLIRRADVRACPGFLQAAIDRGTTGFGH